MHDEKIGLNTIRNKKLKDEKMKGKRNMSISLVLWRIKEMIKRRGTSLILKKMAIIVAPP